MHICPLWDPHSDRRDGQKKHELRVLQAVTEACRFGRPTLNPHVQVQRPRIVLPPSVAFLTRWATCHLQSWCMFRGASPPLHGSFTRRTIGPPGDVHHMLIQRRSHNEVWGFLSIPSPIWDLQIAGIVAPL